MYGYILVMGKWKTCQRVISWLTCSVRVNDNRKGDCGVLQVILVLNPDMVICILQHNTTVI